MARSSRSRSASNPPPALTVDRAARLCRLLQLLGQKPQTRAALLRRLRIDIRGFYRDLQLLREIKILVTLQDGKYSLEGDAEEALLRIPFPDPHLTLGEAAQLSKGRGAVQKKIKELLEQILP